MIKLKKEERTHLQRLTDPCRCPRFTSVAAGLRDAAGQRLLSELASLPNVHLAASCDHVNSSLLWDLQARDRFSWAWHNATTFEAYSAEVAAAAVPALLVGRREECSRQAAAVVLASLSRNAREVFKVLAEGQGRNEEGQAESETGLSFQRLFQACRERFLVSNEPLLRSFLTEFRDHDLLHTRSVSFLLSFYFPLYITHAYIFLLEDISSFLSLSLSLVLLRAVIITMVASALLRDRACSFLMLCCAVQERCGWWRAALHPARPRGIRAGGPRDTANVGRRARG
jgi:hypothetical protein